MTVTVSWAPCTNTPDPNEPAKSIMAAELMALEPVPLLKYVLETRADTKYLKCYSVLDVCKNSFVVLSPYDLTVTLDKENNFVTVQEFSTYFFNRMCLNRGPTDRGHLLTMPPALVFFSKADVTIEVMPTHLVNLPRDTALISGRYNISKWVRPLDWTFELINGAATVAVKRGDPLFVVRFTPKNDDTVKLEQVPFTEELHKTMAACTQVKRLMPRTSLGKLYTMSEAFINRFLRR